MGLCTPRALRALSSVLTVLASACALDPPVTGRVCASDDDCVAGASGDEYHCELAAAPQLCLPGPAGVARRPNRPPYALDTLVVVPVGFGQQATLQLVDPDGDDKRVTSAGGQFGAGGVTASVTVLDAEEGVLGIDTTGAIEGVVPFTLADALDNTAVVQVFVVAIDEAALVRWTGAVSSAFSDGANWDGGAPPGAGQSFLVADNGAGSFDPEVDIDVDAADAPSEGFVLFDAALNVPDDRRLTITSRFLNAGGAGGAGTIALVDDGARIGGRAPSVEVANAALQGALSASSVRGDALTVVAGTALATQGDVALRSLTLEAAAVVDADGNVEAETLTMRGAAIDTRTVVVRGERVAAAVVVEDVADDVGESFVWRLFVDTIGAATVSVAQLDGVAIGASAAVDVGAGGTARDVVLEGGVRVEGGATWDVGTLHFPRQPVDLSPSGLVRASSCDVPPQVAIAVPPYVQCAASSTRTTSVTRR